MRVRLLLTLLAIPALPAQVALAELAQLARARAERARPAQEKALEPFWVDLSLDYRQSQPFLDQRIEQAAALGDSVVPLLLEKLAPNQSGEAARHLAANCRRVLEHLDPSSFVDALAELAHGRSDVARNEAIRLLGAAHTAQAERLLADLLGQVKGDDQRQVVKSLTRLKSKAAAQKVAQLLGSADRSVREDALDCLIAARAGDVADTVVQALSVEKDNHLLPRYVDYFESAVSGHDGAARALLGLIGERLDWQDTKSLVQALGTVAPPNHDATCRRLHEMLEAEDTSALAVQAAVTLRRLGDEQGVTKVKRALDEQLRKPQRKREATLYEQRASLYFAIDKFSDASDDYEKILEYSDSMAMTRRAWMGLIRCEAHRRRWAQMMKAMKTSGMTVGELEAMASADDTLRDAFRVEKVKSFLQQLAKDQAPR